MKLDSFLAKKITVIEFFLFLSFPRCPNFANLFTSLHMQEQIFQRRMNFWTRSNKENTEAWKKKKLNIEEISMKNNLKCMYMERHVCWMGKVKAIKKNKATEANNLFI